MTTEKLFDDGKYMVIYLYPESVKFDERIFFLWTKNDHEQVKARGNSCEDMVSYRDKLLAWKSLILVSGSPYRIDTTDFADSVRKYNNLPPFNFPKVRFPTQPDINIHITIYAAHLYDSVILYAKVGFKLAKINYQKYKPSEALCKTLPRGGFLSSDCLL